LPAGGRSGARAPDQPLAEGSDAPPGADFAEDSASDGRDSPPCEPADYTVEGGIYEGGSESLARMDEDLIGAMLGRALMMRHAGLASSQAVPEAAAGSGASLAAAAGGPAGHITGLTGALVSAAVSAPVPSAPAGLGGGRPTNLTVRAPPGAAPIRPIFMTDEGSDDELSAAAAAVEPGGACSGAGTDGEARPGTPFVTLEEEEAATAARKEAERTAANASKAGSSRRRSGGGRAAAFLRAGRTAAAAAAAATESPGTGHGAAASPAAIAASAPALSPAPASFESLDVGAGGDTLLLREAAVLSGYRASLTVRLVRRGEALGARLVVLFRAAGRRLLLPLTAEQLRAAAGRGEPPGTSEMGAKDRIASLVRRALPALTVEVVTEPSLARDDTSSGPPLLGPSGFRGDDGSVSRLRLALLAPGGEVAARGEWVEMASVAVARDRAMQTPMAGLGEEEEDEDDEDEDEDEDEDDEDEVNEDEDEKEEGQGCHPPHLGAGEPSGATATSQAGAADRGSRQSAAHGAERRPGDGVVTAGPGPAAGSPDAAEVHASAAAGPTGATHGDDGANGAAAVLADGPALPAAGMRLNPLLARRGGGGLRSTRPRVPAFGAASGGSLASVRRARASAVFSGAGAGTRGRGAGGRGRGRRATLSAPGTRPSFGGSFGGMHAGARGSDTSAGAAGAASAASAASAIGAPAPLARPAGRSYRAPSNDEPSEWSNGASESKDPEEGELESRPAMEAWFARNGLTCAAARAAGSFLLPAEAAALRRLG